MGRQVVVKCSMLAALVAGAVALVLPATGSADALVNNRVPCDVFRGANVYEGSGTNVVTPAGLFILTCHTSLVSGTPVAQTTKSTVGNCEIVEMPSGQANMRCVTEL